MQPYKNEYNGLLKGLEEELDIEIIYLIYNENCEISRSHITKICNFLKKLKTKSVLIILEGIGGDAVAGKLLAIELKKKFTKNYFVAVPNFAMSSLCFPIFSATTLFMDSTSYVSPVEPLIRDKSGWYTRPISTLVLMKDSDKSKSNKAKKEWSEQATFIFQLLNLPCSICKIKELNREQIEKITRLFLLTPHDTHIRKSDLSSIKFCCWDMETEEWQTIKEFTNSTKSNMVKNKKIEFLIGSSDCCYSV